MYVSEARIAANRRNAQLSTGPKTQEGKEKSRANAIKHGLCSSVVVVEDRELVRGRSLDFFWSLNPQTEYHSWIVDAASLLSLKIDRCARMERRTREKIALKAMLGWDDDRRLEAEMEGNRLAKHPAETVEALMRTPHGCEWMMSRWAMLAHAADVNKSWTEDQSSLAFDLLATPRQFREGIKPGTALDFEGKVVAEAGDPAAVARAQIAILKARREVAADLDEVERSLTESDLSHDNDPELRRIRKYEGSLHRKLGWYMAQLQDKPNPKFPGRGVTPQWAVEPKPEPKTDEEKAVENWNPRRGGTPFCLTPDEYPEPGQDADIPAIVQGRKQKKIARADARREARRRKLDRLRA